MLSVLYVGIGGFIGSTMRYGLSLIPYRGNLPVMTLLTNFIGAIVIGMVMEYSFQNPRLSAPMILFLKTGICGGFTTFSTFSLETVGLLEKGHILLGMSYAVMSVILCLLGVMIGKIIIQSIVHQA